jgi:ribonuclease VapC
VTTDNTVVVDSSVVVAIFKREPDGPSLTERVLSFERRIISAANFLEAAIICEAWGKPSPPHEFDLVIGRLHLEVVPVTSPQMEIARKAHRRFGRRRGRPAVLNFGDCFSYALAKELDAPLLYKGNDFGRTDIVAA